MQTSDSLYNQARKRVEFKSHLFVYAVIMAALWIIWAITGQGYPWPAWPMLGWGIGILFHYLEAYHPSRFFSLEEEYKKLKMKRGNRIEQPEENK